MAWDGLLGGQGAPAHEGPCQARAPGPSCCKADGGRSAQQAGTVAKAGLRVAVAASVEGAQALNDGCIVSVRSVEGR